MIFSRKSHLRMSTFSTHSASGVDLIGEQGGSPFAETFFAVSLNLRRAGFSIKILFMIEKVEKHGLQHT